MEENNFKKEYLDWRTHLVKHAETESLEHLHFFFRKEKKKEVIKDLEEFFKTKTDEEREFQEELDEYKKQVEKDESESDAIDGSNSHSDSVWSQGVINSEDFDFGSTNSFSNDLAFRHEETKMDFLDPDADLIIDLAEEKSAAYYELHESEFHKIRKYVLENSGVLEDASDLFQEGIVILLEKIREPQFKFSCRVGTYLYSCCKNIWRNQLRRKKLQENIDYFDLYDEENVQIALEDSEHTDERLKWVLDKLSESCLKLIKAFYYEVKPWSEIAVELNYASEGSAKNQKYKCLKGIVT